MDFFYKYIFPFISKRLIIWFNITIFVVMNFWFANANNSFKGVTVDMKQKIIWHFYIVKKTLETVNWCKSQFVRVGYSFCNHTFLFENLEQRFYIYYAIWSIIYSDLAYLS